MLMNYTCNACFINECCCTDGNGIFWKALKLAVSWYLISRVFQLDMMGQKIAYPNAVLNITALNEEIADVSNDILRIRHPTRSHAYTLYTYLSVN